MDPNGHRRTRTVPHPILIPMQDLSRPPETPERSDTPSSHRRTLSERVRNGVTRSDSRAQGSYTPLGKSPIRLRPGNSSIRPVTPLAQQQRDGGFIEEEEDDERSPLADRGQFSEAMAFSTFGMGMDDPSTPMGASVLPGGSQGMDNLLGEADSMMEFPDLDDDPEYEAPMLDDDDRMPLTDSSFLRPSSSHSPSANSAKKSDRSRGRSVRFSTSGMTPGSRLGDDLANAEAGLSPGGRPRRSTSRSLSPHAASSPLHRASTVVRKMSQRIVNLSNEPEPIELEQDTGRRASSARKASFNVEVDSDGKSEEPDVSYDGARSIVDSAKSAKVSSVIEDKDWKRRANPLRGHSLGLFSPNNWLRTMLCDLLVHPITEPLILILIVLQTVVLAIQAAPNFFDQVAANGLELGGWGNSWFDFALLGLFGIYTVEVVVRVIVSGFVLNPVEYSTIDRRIGWKPALRAWWRNLFTLHEDRIITSQRPAQPDPGSILRTLTQGNMDPTFRGGARQARRVRLGHRAFLRHSFNRLDFLAVVSFWISFAFAFTGIQGNKHVYAFRMLSSLRILRLLGLTNGTHVCSSKAEAWFR